MNAYDIKAPGKNIYGNPYPGRGIVLGRTVDGKKSALAYFIMGRSQNSRNRVFAETDDGIQTQPYDPAKVTDPSLIIYNPVRFYNGAVIVSNGSQTDTIRDFLSRGSTFEEALYTREFEPDAPNYTPRISGLLLPDGSYKLSVLKSVDKAGSACERYFFAYPGTKGLGHFIHTYKTDGDPLPPFFGEPERVCVPDSADELAEELWDGLNKDNRISLYVAYIELATGKRVSRIINKNK